MKMKPSRIALSVLLMQAARAFVPSPLSIHAAVPRPTNLIVPLKKTCDRSKRLSSIAFHRASSPSMRGGSLDLSSSPLNSSNSSSAFIYSSTSTRRYVSTASSSAAEGDTNIVQEEEESISIEEEIESAARSCLQITGTNIQPIPSTFANSIPYLDTSSLSDDKTNHHQHRVLFVLGGPGAGKGTQSERIVNSYKCVHLSVGELLRKERERGSDSPHAELIEHCLVSGQIVPVEISLNLLRNAMDEAYQSSSYGARLFLVDGFPRNFDNLLGWMANMPSHSSVLGALVYNCPEEILEARILDRAKTSGRSDDNLTSMKKRFRTFQEQTMPVVHSLEKVEEMQKDEQEGRSKIHVCSIAGEGTIEQVWDETKSAMDGYVMNDVLSANQRLMDAINNDDHVAYAALCDESMLKIDSTDDTSSGNDGDDDDDDDKNSMWRQAFEKYEISIPEADKVTWGQSSTLHNANIEIHDGTRATVSYDRVWLSGKGSGDVIGSLRETRVWSHGENGWVCVHFVRKPL